MEIMSTKQIKLMEKKDCPFWEDKTRTEAQRDLCSCQKKNNTNNQEQKHTRRQGGEGEGEKDMI